MKQFKGEFHYFFLQPSLSLDICLTYPELLTHPACAGHKLSLDVCMANPQLLTRPSCAGIG